MGVMLPSLPSRLIAVCCSVYSKKNSAAAWVSFGVFSGGVVGVGASASRAGVAVGIAVAVGALVAVGMRVAVGSGVAVAGGGAAGAALREQAEMSSNPSKRLPSVLVVRIGLALKWFNKDINDPAAGQANLPGVVIGYTEVQ